MYSAKKYSEIKSELVKFIAQLIHCTFSASGKLFPNVHIRPRKICIRRTLIHCQAFTIWRAKGAPECYRKSPRAPYYPNSPNPSQLSYILNAFFASTAKYTKTKFCLCLQHNLHVVPFICYTFTIFQQSVHYKPQKLGRVLNININMSEQ